MKNIKITFVVLVVLSIFLPGVINWLFKTEAPCDFLVAEWSAGEALNYTGTFFSAIVTIVGVFLSINYASKNTTKEIRDSVKPYLALNYYEVIHDDIIKVIKDATKKNLLIGLVHIRNID